MTSQRQKNAGYLLPDQITGHPLLCVCLMVPNVEEYRTAFLQQVWELGAWGVWEKSYTPGDTRAKEAAEYWRELLLEYLDMSCCDDDLSAAAYSLAASMAQDIQNMLDRYDGTPSSVHPDAPDDYFDGDGSSQRQQALCMALDAFVNSWFEEWRRKAEIILAGGIVALFFGAVPVIGWVAVAVIAALAYVSQVALDAVADEDARDAVICCMYGYLVGNPISKTDFANSLNTCSFTSGSNEAILRDLLAADIGKDANWVSFLNALGTAYNLALAGVVDCECVGEYAVVYNFDQANMDGWNDVAGQWATTEQFYSTGQSPYEIRADSTFSSFDGLLKVAVLGGRGGTPTPTLNVEITHSGGTYTDSMLIPLGTSWKEFELPSALNGVTYIEFQSSTQVGLSVSFDKFRLIGEGENPPRDSVNT